MAPRSQEIALVVHDFIAFKYAKHNHWFATLVERLSLGRALERSGLVVTVSSHTWRDLELIKPEYQTKPHVVVTPAIGPEVQYTNETRMDLPKRFLLAVGTLQPRKNIEGVIKAFEQVAERHKDLELVIAGGRGWKSSQIFKAIPAWLRERIHFLGYVRYDQLMELYSRALMLVFPSHYEGFGIPPLEAMACGCPVIVSNVSSLPEVVEDAAILVDPENTDEIAEAIKNLMDPTPQGIAKERGFKQATKFSWDASAQTLLLALNKTLK
jgi:glycosyltransferase involved in cell wall biosynthesis